jgi:uncharacterized protein (TIGR03437 family)
LVQITAAGIVNAASFRAGPVAPGEIITIFGTGFGPADTRVLFDGTPARMIYTVENQLSVIVPYWSEPLNRDTR